MALFNWGEEEEEPKEDKIMRVAKALDKWSEPARKRSNEAYDRNLELIKKHQKEREERQKKFEQDQEATKRKFEEQQKQQQAQNIRDQEERIEKLRLYNNQLEESGEDLEGKKLKSLHLDFD